MSWMLDPDGGGYPIRLRELIEGGEPLAVPGAFSPLVGLIARDVGFEALYFSGAAFSASLGLPDIGLFTLEELTNGVRWLVRASALPLIVDADTGFGGPMNVVRTVRELEEAGAAAVQIEDQVMPKRCGHLDGKAVVPADQFVQKLRAAERTRESMLIVARTDSRATHGLDEAIRRGRVYREAGADVIFPEALESEEEFTAYADAVGGPLMANMTEFGKTPYTSVDRFHAMGYGIVIFPVTALRVAAKAVEQALTELRDAGTQIGLVDRMQTRQELYRLIGYDAYETLDRRLSGD